jgi:hypothetical protein
MSRVEHIRQEGGRVLRRAYYDNGSIESEAILMHERGLADGICRRWHRNGVLAGESSFDRGLCDGVQRIWNANGKLLDAFEMEKGTGVLRLWTLDRNSHWSLSGETTMVDGQMTGRHIVYFDEECKTGIATYWIEDKKLSKKRYLEACQKDPKLPRYETESPVRRPTIPRARHPKKPAEPVKVSDELHLRLLNGPAVREALRWLEESREPSRSLGEATTQGESLRLVKKLHSLGALAVHAVEIDGAPNDHQNSGKLIIELPPDAERRKTLLAFTNRLARRLGFDPDPDGGQRYVLLMLD